MSHSGQPAIGFDRKIEIEWLDAIAGRLAAGASPREARDYAWGLLEGVVAGNSPHAARGKTLTVLSRIWLTIPAEIEPLRAATLKHFTDASPSERLAIQWAMATAAYPFFLDLATSVGRLSHLNGSVSLSHIRRRLVETWGDRSTVPRAGQRVLRSMVQWGALQDAGAGGRYIPIARKMVVSSDVAQLLLEGVLHAQGRSMPLGQLTGHPSLFPFSVQVDLGRLRLSRQLRLHRQGDQVDVVELTQPKSAALPAASSITAGKTLPAVQVVAMARAERRSGR